MMNKGSWRACVSAVALAFALPAHAIVILTGEYEIGTSSGATGVTSGDTVHISAFYDPLYAQLTYQNQWSVVHTFGAEHAGLTITVGDLVWRTTGPITLNTYYHEDQLGRPKYVGVDFIGATRLFMEGQATSTLDTPWSSDVTGQEWLYYLPQFTSRVGLDPAQILGPRLYTEEDFESSLVQIPNEFIGSALAETANGSRFFNVRDPNYVGPIASVPEPGVLALFGIGLLGLAVSRRRAYVSRTTWAR
ncbi:MAG TPA: PEP-CTERM sorting domain-containing protein [Steroidobacter sp.]|uniref:PEP-CTERM sorting domain-containing protein n=1 Tax=Steroidobacter sp. TaxID=1978227 RepID=UPI002ED999A3